MLVPAKFVTNENITNIIDILNYSANSCYNRKIRSIIYNIVEKFDKQSKLLKKINKIFNFEYTKYGFWGTMFFDDADIAYDGIENNDIYLSNTGTSKTQKLKYNEPYFGNQLF